MLAAIRSSDLSVIELRTSLFSRFVSTDGAIFSVRACWVN